MGTRRRSPSKGRRRQLVCDAKVERSVPVPRPKPHRGEDWGRFGRGEPPRRGEALGAADG